jgi:uncharacterized phage protein gp47/JayE
MPFDVPDLTTLVERIETDFEARLPGTDARTRRSTINVLSRVQAGAMSALYGYLGWIARQILPDQADAEVLDRHGRVWGVQRKAADYAAGLVIFTGVNGAIIPFGSRLRRADGQEFSADAPGIIADGSVDLPVVALTAGSGGNTTASTKLSLVSPVAGVSSAVTVGGDGLAGGADGEDDEDLRARILQRIRQSPAGGAAHDYERWALEAPGVTRVWVSALEGGPGTVTVRVMMDDLHPDAAPAAAAIAGVQTYIDERRPVTADVLVAAPVLVPLDITLSVTPDTPAVRAAVAAELADLIAREAAPGGTIILSHIRAAISAAIGEEDYVLIAPAASVQHATGEMPVIGNVSWA